MVFISCTNQACEVFLSDLGEDGTWETEDDRRNLQVSQTPEGLVASARVKTGVVIQGRHIVWRDARHSLEGFGDEIYLYDMGADRIFGTEDDRGEFRVAKLESRQSDPDVFDRRVVWLDYRYSPAQVVLFDLGADGMVHTRDDNGPFLISPHTNPVFDPHVYKEKIVWQTNRSLDGYSIDVHDLGWDGVPSDDDARHTVSAPCPVSLPACVIRPRLFGDKVAWTQKGEAGQWIEGYDLGDDSRAGTADDVRMETWKSLFLPLVLDDFSDEQIAFTANQNRVPGCLAPGVTCPSDAFAYGLGPDGVLHTPDDAGEIRLTSQPHNQERVRVSENRFLARESINGIWNLYLYTITASAPAGFRLR